jgi:hypothetical protein
MEAKLARPGTPTQRVQVNHNTHWGLAVLEGILQDTAPVFDAVRVRTSGVRRVAAFCTLAVLCSDLHDCLTPTGAPDGQQGKIGKHAHAIELAAEELEDRIAPITMNMDGIKGESTD